MTVASLLADDRAWDAFVASVPSGGYTQLTAWAEVKAVNGWTARRIAVPAVTGLAAGQMLLHRLGPSPWSVGYLPRGPIAAAWDREAAVALTAAVRTMAARLRLSHVTIEPPIPAGDVLEGWLREAGWQPGIAIQPARTRIVDLERSEAELWADLRSKWRQYVGSAGRAGVVAAETGREGLAEFARIYHETATRGGFLPRAASALESVYEAFAARDAARLLIARMPGGEAVAGLMLLSCGRGVVEPYGGMTAAGAESHANYLLKWEAIRSSRERGFGSYDVWGLASSGIEQFKAGFGGREVHYSGAWDLIANGPVHRAVGVGQQLRTALARGSRGLAIRPPRT